MILSLPALIGGALTLVALAAAVRALLPARPSAAEALRRTHQPAVPSAPAHGAAGRGQEWAQQIGERLLATEAVASRLPAKDLRLLDLSPAQLLGRCVSYALLGLLLPQFLLLLATVVGVSVPFAVPVGASLVCAAFFAFKCLDDVHDKAKTLRHEYRYAVISLLERIAVARAAEASAGEALTRAATVGDSTPALQIREALDHARMSGITPWKALEDLGAELGVPELRHPARALALAGEEKAAVQGVLESQIEAQRTALLAQRKAAANAATERMDIPSLAVGLCLVLFAAIPAFIRILNL